MYWQILRVFIGDIPLWNMNTRKEEHTASHRVLSFFIAGYMFRLLEKKSSAIRNVHEDFFRLSKKAKHVANNREWQNVKLWLMVWASFCQNISCWNSPGNWQWEESEKCGVINSISALLILVNNQPDALFHVFIYSFHLSTCFEHQVLIIRRSNCINTSSGMISLCKWLLGMPDRHT